MENEPLDPQETEATPVVAEEPTGDALVEASAAEAVQAVGAEVDAPPVKAREHIKGIHPELLCQCTECAPEQVELQWFTVDEARKVKGTAMLFCGNSGRKYFTPVPDLQAFLTANPVRGRKHQQV